VAWARASASNWVRSSSAKVMGGAYGTGIGAIRISCQEKQRCVLCENDHNSQSCPAKRLGRDLRNGHLADNEHHLHAITRVRDQKSVQRRRNRAARTEVGFPIVSELRLF
jgi:hypothetical protein